MDSEHNPSDGPPEAQGDSAPDRGTQASGFAPTQADSLGETPVDWWPESSDGQCSQSAALFAASQPAPLSVV